MCYDYNYPLDYRWSTEEIIDVMALYNAVEKAYEEGISKEEFMQAYRKFKQLRQKSEEKAIGQTILRNFSLFYILVVVKATKIMILFE